MDSLTAGLRRNYLKGSVWPPMTLGGAANLAAMLDGFRITERMDPERVEALQGAQLAAVAAHHRVHTPAFAERLSAAGLSSLDSLDDLRRLPLMSRRDLQVGERAFAREVPEAHRPTHIQASNGSTGEPVRVSKTRVQLMMWAALTLRDLHWHGVDFASRITTVRPQATHYWEGDGWGRPVDDLYVSGPAQWIPILIDPAEQAAHIRRFEPQVLVTFPCNLGGLADGWEAEGGAPPSLTCVRTLGETLHPELRERILALTGLTIQDHYSAQEVGSIAVQCEVSGLYHVMSEAVLVEVLGDDLQPCGEGEAGRVVVTDLHNLATPVIRYDIGDWALLAGRCPCGRTLPTLARILGRERNLLTRPDGRRHWPHFANLNEGLTSDGHPVRQFQFIQTSRTDLELRVVTDEPLTADDEAAMAVVVRRVFDAPFEVSVRRFEGRLPTGPGGKFEQYLNLAT